ncbi:MAG: nicotinamide mononucleotide transporter [Gemmatimonadaceae bacterium]|nr:nicotinamide mononucleotide transporter [Gemmatimonadaceae bacterium]
MNGLEITAAGFGVISVYLSVRQNIWSWPTAIVSVGMYTLVFYRSRLYADMGLQVVYVVLSLYGWYQWLYGGSNRTELKVSRTGRRVAFVLFAAVLTSAAILGTLLHRHTDAAIPYVDSVTTSTSLAAQWMMTRKLVENWLVWAAVDVVYIAMFINRSLHVTAILYAAYLVLSAVGYFKWRQAWRNADGAALAT